MYGFTLHSQIGVLNDGGELPWYAIVSHQLPEHFPIQTMEGFLEIQKYCLKFLWLSG